MGWNGGLGLLMGFKYEFDDNGITERLSKAETIIAGRANRMLRDIGQAYSLALRSETPVRTGKLKKSTRFQIVGGNTSQALEVRQGARSSGGDFYGGYVRMGTAPHEIRPVKASALVFRIGDRLIFVKKVNHPGTKPNRYDKRALAKTSDQIDEISRQAGIRIAADLME